MTTSSVNKSLSQLSCSEMLNMSYAEALARIQSGEWGIEQFTLWMENRCAYEFGDGYEEGYTTGEEQERLNNGKHYDIKYKSGPSFMN